MCWVSYLFGVSVDEDDQEEEDEVASDDLSDPSGEEDEKEDDDASSAQKKTKKRRLMSSSSEDEEKEEDLSQDQSIQKKKEAESAPTSSASSAKKTTEDTPEVPPAPTVKKLKEEPSVPSRTSVKTECGESAPIPVVSSLNSVPAVPATAAPVSAIVSTSDVQRQPVASTPPSISSTAQVPGGRGGSPRVAVAGEEVRTAGSPAAAAPGRTMVERRMSNAGSPAASGAGNSVNSHSILQQRLSSGGSQSPLVAAPSPVYPPMAAGQPPISLPPLRPEATRRGFPNSPLIHRPSPMGGGSPYGSGSPVSTSGGPPPPPVPGPSSMTPLRQMHPSAISVFPPQYPPGVSQFGAHSQMPGGLIPPHMMIQGGYPHPGAPMAGMGGPAPSPFGQPLAPAPSGMLHYAPLPGGYGIHPQGAPPPPSMVSSGYASLTPMSAMLPGALPSSTSSGGGGQPAAGSGGEDESLTGVLSHAIQDSY